MDCIRFDEKLFDYIEGEIDDNTKKEMEQHIDVCKSCKEKYEIKLKFRNSLKKACFVERKGLASIRKHVIKEIDRNKYNKKISNKLYFLFSRLIEEYQIRLDKR